MALGVGVLEGVAVGMGVFEAVGSGVVVGVVVFVGGAVAWGIAGDAASASAPNPAIVSLSADCPAVGNESVSLELG